jgi:hypothetical protein
MIRARKTRNLAPYNAKNTLDFIQDKFVKNNENVTHIAWTKILLHTRLIGQAIYQWQASFDPLIRKFEQARSKKMRRKHLKDIKQPWAKQLTDNSRAASTAPSLTPVISPHLKQGTQRTCQPRTHRMLVFDTFSCLAFIVAFVLA